MKKVLLILFTVLMITVSGNCQWLQRKYGANDINQLSVEQLNNALSRAKSKVWSGAIISYFGTTSLLLAVSIKNPGNTTRGPGGEGRAYRDAFLVMGSALDLVGLPILLTNCTRLKTIKKALRKTKISFEPSVYHPDNIFNYPGSTTMSGLSLTINF